MSKYTIRPTRKGFGVYSGRTIFGRMKMIAEHERLWDAEVHTLHLVTQDYHRLLDYQRVTNQVMSTDMMEPRREEEHVYTALMLAGKKIPNADDTEDDYRRTEPKEDETTKYDHILEPVLGKPLTQTARVMFEERLMTWYGQQNPGWIDPRREREFMPAQSRMGRNRYGMMAAAAAPPPPPTIKQWLNNLNARATLIRRAIFGPPPLTPEDIKRDAADFAAANVPQTGRSMGGSLR